MRLTWQQQQEVDRVNARFDRQAKNQKIFEVHKQLFNLSLSLSITDWMQIRSGDFWAIHDKITDPNERLIFTLTRVNEYLNQ